MSAPRAVALIACLLASSPYAYALNPDLDISQYGHTSWKIRDGFFKSRITVMAQTPDGYLWLGTDLGLLRFDGVRTVPLQLPPGQSLPRSFIRSLHVGRDGTLWIGTLGGLASWKDGTLRQYPEVTFTVNSLLEDRAGTLWAGGSEAAAAGSLCAIHNDSVRCYGNRDGLGRVVISLYEDDSGALWVAADTGLWQWTPKAPKFYELAEPVGGGLQSLTRGDQGMPLIATRGGISQVVNGSIQRLRLPSDAPMVRSPKLLRDRDGGLWVGTDRGVVHVHRGRAETLTQVEGLSGDSVNRFFEDREGNIWVATLEGLDRFRELAAPTISTRQGLPSGPVSAVLASPDNSVWLNANGALSRWTNRQITTYDSLRVAGGSVGSLFRDDRGRIWLSTVSGVGHLGNDRLNYVNGVPGGIVVSIANDVRGFLWLAYQDRGLVRVSPDGEVDQIPWSTFGKHGPASGMAADRVRGGLWIGFYEGGLSYYTGGQIGEAYSARDGLASGRVAFLRADRDGTLWAAAEGGLSRLKNGRIATLTSKNGLPCDSVHWMVEDDVDSVWLRQDCGLVRIARSELDVWASEAGKDGKAQPKIQVTTFENADGITSGSYVTTYSPSVDKSSDGRLWFADNGGVTVLDPRHLPLNQLPPSVHVEQVVVDRTPFDVSSGARQTLRLPPLARDLQIDYTALSLVAPEKMQFRYKLEGHDSDWQDAGTRRQAFYSNLSPGNYRFRVIASNNSGVWNEEGATLDFAIAPAYYQTTWFLALAAGMVLAVVWGAHRVRLRIVEQHQREISALNERLMKAQEQERIRIAGELHDGVMQQMLSATMMLGTAKRRIVDNSDDAKATIEKVQDKLVQVGTDIRRLSHGLHPPVLQEAGLPKAVQTYCEQFSATTNIPVSCEADEDASSLSRGAALALFRIVQEALGNAAKHAHAKRITVRLTRSDGMVSLVVADDGVGFDATRLGTAGGLGLIMMRERASQLNGTFAFESAPGRGTTISIVIPFR